MKRYQVIEPLDVLEELNESTRLVIYPSIHAVLSGDDIRALLQTFGEADERQERLETEDDMKEITGGTTIGEDTGVSGAL